jgi:hypothetical protein
MKVFLASHTTLRTRVFLFKVIHPFDKLPPLQLKDLICSVFCTRVPSLNQWVPVLKHWRLVLTLPSQLQYLHCPGIVTQM